LSFFSNHHLFLDEKSEEFNLIFIFTLGFPPDSYLQLHAYLYLFLVRQDKTMKKYFIIHLVDLKQGCSVFDLIKDDHGLSHPLPLLDWLLFLEFKEGRRLIHFKF